MKCFCIVLLLLCIEQRFPREPHLPSTRPVSFFQGLLSKPYRFRCRQSHANVEIEVELVMEKGQGAGSNQLLVYGYARSVSVGVIHHARLGGRVREEEESGGGGGR